MKMWWLVLDSSGEPVTSSASRIECLKQIKWFLPKPSNQYSIESILIPGGFVNDK
jgi:hypothetical protein